MKDKKKLILVTDNYPFGTGETFLEPELPFLLDYFEPIIISASFSSEMTRKVDSSIPVYHYIPARSRRRITHYIFYFLSFVFSSAGFFEALEIVKKKEKVIKRLYHSLEFFADAEEFYRWMLRLKLLKGQEECIFYSYWNNANVLSLARHRERHPSVKLVSRFHGYDLYNERRNDGRQPFKKYMDSRIDKAVFISEFGLKYYLITFDIEKTQRHTVSRLGTNNQYGPTPYRRSGVFDLVSCSDVIPIKRINLIIDALALTDQIQICWQHFGGGKDSVKIMEYAKERLLQKENVRYTFHDAVSNSTILRFYESNKVDCFITASAMEGIPVSIMETLSYGIPVIATAVGGISEMLRNSDNYLLAPDPAPEEISKAIIRMHGMERNEMDELRKECREIWEQNYMASANYPAFAQMLNYI